MAGGNYSGNIADAGAEELYAEKKRGQKEYQIPSAGLHHASPLTCCPLSSVTMPTDGKARVPAAARGFQLVGQAAGGMKEREEKRPKSPVVESAGGDAHVSSLPPPCKGNRLTMKMGEVCPACGFIGLVSNEAGPEVAHLAGASPLHDPYPLLCSALPGGKHRGRRIREAKDPAKAGKTLGGSA